MDANAPVKYIGIKFAYDYMSKPNPGKKEFIWSTSTIDQSYSNR